MFRPNTEFYKMMTVRRTHVELLLVSVVRVDVSVQMIVSLELLATVWTHELSFTVNALHV